MVNTQLEQSHKIIQQYLTFTFIFITPKLGVRGTVNIAKQTYNYTIYTWDFKSLSFSNKILVSYNYYFADLYPLKIALSNIILKYQ